jgi:hypothetical protein
MVDQYKIRHVIFAGVHADIIPFLAPDWVYSTDSGELSERGKSNIPQFGHIHQLSYRYDVLTVHRFTLRLGYHANTRFVGNAPKHAEDDMLGLGQAKTRTNLVWPLAENELEVTVLIQRCNADVWKLFERHHYLNEALSKTSKCYVALVGAKGGVPPSKGVAAGFLAVLPFPGKMRNAWAEHRLVVLPRFQGLGTQFTPF